MLSILLVTLVMVAGSWVVGSAVQRGAGMLRAPWTAATGLALLMCASAAAIRLPGHGLTAGVAIGAAVVAAAALAGRRLPRPGPVELTVVALTVAAMSIPFAVNGRIGIVGMSFTDDMALHLALADSLRWNVDAVLAAVVDGYPIGPHALAGGLASLLGLGSPITVTALYLVVAALTGLVALTLFDEALGAVWRVLGAVTVALAYLAVAFYVEGSLKEPIMALLVLAFAVALREVGRAPVGARARAAVPLGLLAAGTMVTYGTSGLAWPGLTVAACALLVMAKGRGNAAAWRSLARPAAVAAGVCALAVVSQADRLLEFSATGAVSAATSGNSAFLGHFLGYLPLAEGLGVWPAPNYRRIPSELALTLGLLGGLAMAAALHGALWWVRRDDPVVALAALGALAVWLGTRVLHGPYVNAKVLAIAAPLLVALSLRALMRPPSAKSTTAEGLVLTAAATTFVALALGSASLPLRAAFVGPLEHSREVASLRDDLGRDPVLFVGRDNFVGWELLGADLSTTSPYGVAFPSRIRVALRPEKLVGVGPVIDVDSVRSSTLDRFHHMITVRSRFASVPPPNWRAVRHTRLYTLWRRAGHTPRREVLPSEGRDPGARLDCASPVGRRLRGSAALAAVRGTPVGGRAGGWRLDGGRRPTADRGGYVAVAPGRTLERSLRLPAGDWELSLQYVGPRDLRVAAPGFRARLGGDLTARTNFWRLGVLRSQGGDVRVRITTGSPPAVGPRPDLLVGALAAVPARDSVRLVPMREACGRYVDWYTTETAP